MVQQKLRGLVSGIQGWAIGIGGALTAALGTRQLVRGLQTVVDELDKVGEMAQKTGLKVSELSTTNFVAALSKSSPEQYQASVTKLNRSIYEAANGVLTYKRAFDDAGISVRDSEGRLKSTNEVMLEMADLFKDLPNGPKKTALAMELMGRSGAEMIPMLNQGAQAIRELQEEARVFGLEVTPEMAQAAGDWNDNLTRLRFAFRGIGNAIAKELLPFMVDLTNRFIRIVKENDRLARFSKWAADGIEWLAKAVIKAAFFVADMNGYLNVGVSILTNLAIVAFDVGKEVVRSFKDMTAAGEIFAEMMKAILSGNFSEAATYGRILKIMAGLMAKRTVEAFQQSSSAAMDGVDQVIQREVAAKAARDRLLAELLAPGTGRPAASIQDSAFDPTAGETSVERAARVKNELADEANQLSEARLSIATRVAMVENDRRRSETQQYRETLALKREELAQVDGYVTSLQRRMDIEEDINAQEQIRTKIEAARRDQANLSQEIQRLLSEGDPSSFGDQLFNAADAMVRRIGTLAQQVARSFTDVMGSAIDGISGSIEGLITRTMDWADALQNVARTIGSSVVSAISRMFAEWIVGRLAAMAKNIFAVQAEGAAETAAKTPGALLTSISSWGTAAVVGLAALTAVMAAVGAFATGGMVQGPGGPKSDSILARLSAGEFVVNADATSRYRGLLEAINGNPAAVPARASVGDGSAVGQAAPDSGSGGRIAIFFVDDIRDVAKRLEQHGPFADVIVRTIRTRKTEVGIS